MKLTFLGATHEVTGSCTLIEINGHYGLVDCGMEQGKDVYCNEEIPVSPSALEFILLTHAHIDHSGRIPLLYKNGADCLIYATEVTCSFSEIMLLDCAYIQESEAEYKTRKNLRAGRDPVEPLYTVSDVEETVRYLRPCEYGSRISICEGLEARFVDAGHLLGSASIELWLTEDGVTRKVVFSGDIGNLSQPIIRDPQYITQADYVITESTYGDRYHEKKETDNISFLAQCIQKTFDRGGTLVIPAFAVGRTQDILYYIRQIKVNGLVHGHDDFTVYFDSPLGIKATSITLQAAREYFDEDALALIDAGENPLMSPGVKIAETVDESKAINFDSSPKVIISASGMCNAGRIKHHLKYNLWKSKNMVLFVGYQANGTLGRIILDGADEVKIFGDTIAVKAEIEYMPGKSGHADKEGLIKWINAFEKTPKVVFVNHGEDNVVDGYADCLCKEYGFTTSAPYSGAEFDLMAGEYIYFPEGKKIK